MALIEKLNAIGDAIREKTGTTEKISLADMPQAISAIVVDSGEEDNAEIIELGKATLANHGISLGESVTALEVVEGFGKIPSLKYAFAFSFRNAIFPENTEIEIDSSNVTNYSMCFYNTNLKKVTLKGNDNKSSVNMQAAFGNNSALSEVDFLKYNMKVSNSSSMFQNNTALTEIKGEFDFSEATNASNMFYFCVALEELRVKANTLSIPFSMAQCLKLSSESVQSIIEGLATIENAQTLTLNSAIALTDEQKSIINAKGWTLVQ